MATKILSATAGLAMLLAMPNSMPLVAEDAPAGATAASATVEEIYILRSVREERVQPAPETCATAHSKLSEPAWEDRYTFRSVTTRPEDGRVPEAETDNVRSIRACFGKTSDPALPVATATGQIIACPESDL